jgi:hypothetical protein
MLRFKLEKEQIFKKYKYDVVTTSVKHDEKLEN